MLRYGDGWMAEGLPLVIYGLELDLVDERRWEGRRNDKLIWYGIWWWSGKYEMRLKRMVWLCSKGMNEDIVPTFTPTSFH